MSYKKLHSLIRQPADYHKKTINTMKKALLPCAAFLTIACMARAQKTDTALANRADNLYAPVEHDGGERGQFEGRVHEHSAYTGAVLHPKRASLIGTAAIAAAFAARQIVRNRRTKDIEPTLPTD